MYKVYPLTKSKFLKNKLSDEASRSDKRLKILTGIMGMLGIICFCILEFYKKKYAADAETFDRISGIILILYPESFMEIYDKVTKPLNNINRIENSTYIFIILEIIICVTKSKGISWFLIGLSILRPVNLIPAVLYWKYTSCIEKEYKIYREKFDAGEVHMLNSSSNVPDALYPMKYYKYITNFQLYLLAFIYFLYSMVYMTGGAYSDNSEWKIAVKNGGIGLDIVNVIYGIFLIVLVGFCIYTRNRLVKYKKNGPICLYFFHFLITLSSVLYDYLFWATTGSKVELFDYGISELALVMLYILILYNYFKKRKVIFIN